MDPEQELVELRSRVAHLESLVERMAGAQPVVRRERAPVGDAGLDRRRMLRNGLGLSAAAVAGVAGVATLDSLGSSAAAADGDAVTIAATSSPTAAGSAPTRILNPSSSVHSAVLLQVDNTTNRTVALPANTSAAIAATFAGNDDHPTLQSAILAVAEFGTGVDGRSDGFVGVAGTSVFGDGVSGTSGSGAGVRAVSTGGAAVSATSTSGRGLIAVSDSGEGIHATSTSNIGIVGDGPFGVVGNGTGASGGTGVGASGRIGVLAQGSDVGVNASSTSGTAVKATSTSGTAITATSTGPGVVATSVVSAGVHGSSVQDAGVWGDSTAAGFPGVLGSHVDGGPGVTGLSQTGIGVSGDCASGVGVEGTSTNGIGVKAASTSGTAIQATSNNGAGVDARSTSGVAARFQGGAAALRLVPQAQAGHPMSGHHDRGELLVDSAGRPWLCTKSGTPGAWRRIAFV